MIYITVCVKEVGIFLCLVYLCTTRIEETLKWALVCFEYNFHCRNNRFVLVVYDIFNAMYEGDKCGFCWIIIHPIKHMVMY